MKSHVERVASRDGYFSPESVVRRVLNSPVVHVLGAGPAMLHQVAHPLVAASVVAHTDFRNDLTRRLAHTLRALYLIVYGSKAEAEQIGEAVRTLHTRVRGRTTMQLGPFPAGTPYSASDPELMLWVHAALTEIPLVVYNRFFHPLAPGEERRYYRDMTLVARLFGVPPSTMPATLAEFREYLRAQLDGSEIVVTQPARQIAAVVLDPPLSAPLRPILRTHRLATAGLLPERLRAEYGLAWDRGRAAALSLAVSSLRVAGAPLVFAAERLLPTRSLLAAEAKQTLAPL